MVTQQVFLCETKEAEFLDSDKIKQILITDNYLISGEFTRIFANMR